MGFVMRRMVGIAALAGGALLVVIPRFVLPACEHQGFPRMHCSDTARGEMLAGALLIGIGVVALIVNGSKATIGPGLVALGLAAVAFILPEKLGYCHSPRMPCTYGMVPAVRFIASVTGLALSTGVLGSVLASRRKGPA